MKLKIAAALAIASAGLAAILVNTWNNAVSINNGEFVINDLTAVVIILAVGSAILSAMFGYIWRRAKALALFALLLMVCCSLTSFSYTVNRLGFMADAGVADALSHNNAIEAIKGDIEALEKSHAWFVKERNAEAKRDKYGRVSKKHGKCSTKCLALQKKVDAHVAEISAAKAKLAAMGGVRSVDPGGSRLANAAHSLGWSSFTAIGWRNMVPLASSIALEGTGPALLILSGMMFGGLRIGSSRQIIDVTPIDPVIEQLRANGSASNRELAKALGWSEAKTSRQVKRLVCEGQVSSRQAGKAKLICLV
jgi:hypothetical protein